VIMAKDYRYPIRSDRIVDLALTVVAFLAAYVVKRTFLPVPLGGLSFAPNYTNILFLIIIIWYVVFEYYDVKILLDMVDLSENIYMVLKAMVISGLILATFFYVLKIEDISRVMLFLFLSFDFLLLGAVRCMVFSKFSEKYPLHNILVIIIGSKVAAKEMIDSISSTSRTMKILGCLDLDKTDVGKVVSDGIKVIGTIEELQEVLATRVVDEVVFVMPIEKIWNAEKYLAVAEAVGVKIRIVPHWHVRKFLSFRPKFYSLHFEPFGQMPTLVLSASPHKRGGLLIKAVGDFVVSALLLLLLLPAMIIIAAMIKSKSPGPVFYRQERCGMFGRRFTLYKFRTMVPDADKLFDQIKSRNIADGPVFKLDQDPRVIAGIGRFLRKTCLDELPQLWNVLKGEMSLVGPRPPIPEEVQKYSLWERRRLSMKPGITCLWQVEPQRNRIPFSKWMELDLHYIDNWSLWLDFMILLKTLRALVRAYGM